MAQVVEHLPSNCETLSSNSSITPPKMMTMLIFFMAVITSLCVHELKHHAVYIKYIQ
jgi:hypothetical protein